MRNLEQQLDAIGAESPEEAGKWKDMSSLSFDATTLEDEELYCMSFRLLVTHNLHKTFNISSATWIKFMDRVKGEMHANPYHNFQHICDVAQTSNAILLDKLLVTKLDDLEKFSLILSSLLHDLDHPGMNNAYQISKGTDLAILYNDISVLESHHCCHASKALFETGILEGIESVNSKKKLRTIMIEAILATDMTKHFAISADLGKFNSDEERNEKLGAADKILIMKSVLHMADISNPAKEWATSKLWSDRVSAEFFNQGDIEKKENMPVSPMCDRDTTSQDESSLGFCDFIVAPYLFNTTMLAPHVLVPACKALASNREIWHNILVERLAATAAGDEKATTEKLNTWKAKRDAFLAKLDNFLENPKLQNLN